MKESYYSGKKEQIQPTAEAVSTNVPSPLVAHALKGLLFAGFTSYELSNLSDQEIMEKYKTSF